MFPIRIDEVFCFPELEGDTYGHEAKSVEGPMVQFLQAEAVPAALKLGNSQLRATKPEHLAKHLRT